MSFEWWHWIVLGIALVIAELAVRVDLNRVALLRLHALLAEKASVPLRLRAALAVRNRVAAHVALVVGRLLLPPRVVLRPRSSYTSHHLPPFFSLSTSRCRCAVPAMRALIAPIPSMRSSPSSPGFATALPSAVEAMRWALAGPN